MSLPRKQDAPFLVDNPGLAFALNEIQRRLAPKPHTYAYDCGDYVAHFSSHYEGSRKLVESIECFTWNGGDKDGQQVSAKELSEEGLGPISELDLQEALDEEWNDEQEELGQRYD